MTHKAITILVLLIGIYYEFGMCYSAMEDARIINQYKRQLRLNATRAIELNHAKIARKLVHQADWAPFGTISVEKAIKGYPMVNVISINDNDAKGKSTGHIQFLLTDLDFTGNDRQYDSKASILLSDEQLLHCSEARPSIDPMEPTCARTIISGRIVKMDENGENYDGAMEAFIKRHPAATKWLEAHSFYLCELNIENIFVLDYYGGPHTVSAADYYDINL